MVAVFDRPAEKSLLYGSKGRHSCYGGLISQPFQRFKLTRQLFYGRMLEKVFHFQPVFMLMYPGGYLDRLDGIASYFKKVLIHSNGFLAQHFGPNGGQLYL